MTAREETLNDLAWVKACIREATRRLTVTREGPSPKRLDVAIREKEIQFLRQQQTQIEYRLSLYDRAEV